MKDAAATIMKRIEALARISDEAGRLTRTFCSPAMRRANRLVASWMRAAGMEVREDAIGNLIGHYPGATRHGKILLLGSHLDTVRNAGKFDGPLGVILAIACVEHLRRNHLRLPFAIEVCGFADEEGVRYQSGCLGSRAVAGLLADTDLRRKDARGVSMADAIRRFGGQPARLKQARFDADRLLGYVEAHIEQGPVLEEENVAVGIVTPSPDSRGSNSPSLARPVMPARPRCACAGTRCAPRRSLFWRWKITPRAKPAWSPRSARFKPSQTPAT